MRRETETVVRNYVWQGVLETETVVRNYVWQGVLKIERECKKLCLAGFFGD